MAKASKPKKRRPKADQHGLTLPDYEFIENRIVKGMSLGDCYAKYNPKSGQGVINRGKSGWATMERIRKKAGSWKDVYAIANLGPDRLAKTYEDALKAENYTDIYELDGKTKKTILSVDHTTRLRAAKDLANIQGIGENVNVNVDITAKDITDNVPFVEKIAAHMAAYDRENNAD